jgi:hypothetical protein
MGAKSFHPQTVADGATELGCTNTPMKKSQAKVGMLVTCRKPEIAYSYSMTRRWFEPGMVGRVAVTGVPVVRGPEGKTFCCIDFLVDDPKNPVDRCGLDYENMVTVKNVPNAKALTARLKAR